MDWLAYPEYTLEDDLTSFVLAPGLYYTSRFVLQWMFCCQQKEDKIKLFWIYWAGWTLAVSNKGKDMNIKVFRIEWAASAMEMSVLAASNVANLIKVELVIYNVTY